MPNAAIPDATTWPSITLMIAALTAFIGIIKLIFDFHFEKNKFHHKNLEIAQSTLSENSHKPSLKQRFLTEQVFRLIYRFNFSYDEISVLLRYANPSNAFTLFVQGAPYLNLSKNMKSIELNGNYWQFKIGRFKFYPKDILHFIRYCSLGVIGTFAVVPAIDVFDTSTWFNVPSIFYMIGLKGIFIFIISTIIGLTLWALAFKAIASIGKIGAAFKFIEVDKKHLTDK